MFTGGEWRGEVPMDELNVQIGIGYPIADLNVINRSSYQTMNRVKTSNVWKSISFSCPLQISYTRWRIVMKCLYLLLKIGAFIFVSASYLLYLEYIHENIIVW